MAVHANSVNVPANTATLLYEAPGGVDTHLTVLVPASGLFIGGSDIETASASLPGGTPFELDDFEGGVFIKSTTAVSVSYVAVDRT